MTEVVDFAPEWAIAPGATIARAIHERGLTYEQLAQQLHRPKRFVVNLIHGSEEITPEVADVLARTVGSTKRFWLAREKEYRDSLGLLSRTKPELEEWVSSLPLKDMCRLGWIRSDSRDERISECLQFFGVSSLERWKQAFETAVVAASFRSSAAYDTDAGALSAWLRKGERDATDLDCDVWNPAKFEAILPRVRRLTRLKSPARFFPQLQSLCSVAGVAVVVVAAPRGCRASGAARFLSPDRALIQLSQRYGTDDQFWFTFFHEAGHLLLHPRVDMFIDQDDSSETREEQEANSFASRMLLSDEQRARLAQVPLTYHDVIKFAREVHLSPGIVVGQLQKSKRLDYDWLNKAKRKLNWSELDD